MDPVLQQAARVAGAEGTVRIMASTWVPWQLALAGAMGRSRAWAMGCVDPLSSSYFGCGFGGEGIKLMFSRRENSTKDRHQSHHSAQENHWDFEIWSHFIRCLGVIGDKDRLRRCASTAALPGHLQACWPLSGGYSVARVAPGPLRWPG